MALVVFLAIVVFAWSLLSRLFAASPVTMPIFCAAAGVIAGPVLGLVPVSSGSLIMILEGALVMVLFADASSLDPRRWTGEASVSGRLLGIGLPLTMLVGGIIAILLFPGIPVWQAGLIGVILAPTDAALGQAVVANPRVPAVVRNALNVESGLNDGLALPFVTIFITLGEIASGVDSEAKALQTLAFVLGVSVVVGIAFGLGGGWLIRKSAILGLGSPRYQGIALAAIAVVAFLLADNVAASGFLAVWIAGLAAGSMVRGHVEEEAFHLSEHASDVLAAAGFTILGTALILPVLARVTPMTLLYAALSLTVARVVPVAISMARSGFALPSVLYIGWFGPRGLASIVFAGAVVEAALPEAIGVIDVILTTVVISIVAHGVTAAWGARRYAAWFERARAANPGLVEAAEMEGPAAAVRGAR